MEIVVETGAGLPTANSYLSTAEADDLLSVNIYSTWATLTDDNKANLLIWASRILDTRVKWNGYKTQPTSGRAWPRYSVRDREGCPIDDNVVPSPVKLATAVLANHLVVNGADPEAVDTANNLKLIEVDVIRLQFDPTIPKEKYPVELKYILQGLGTVSMGRGGPKYIVLH